MMMSKEMYERIKAANELNEAKGNTKEKRNRDIIIRAHVECAIICIAVTALYILGIWLGLHFN